MKTTGSNVCESGKGDVLERFGASLFEIQDYFQEALFSNSLSEDDNGDAIRVAQKRYALERATVKRLRAKLRAKEKVVMSLQKAIETSCECALDQQDKDKTEIACLHDLLSRKDEQSLEDIKAALKELIKNKPDAAKGLAGHLASLLDEKLSELLSRHEGKMEEMRDSLETWKKRCQDLEMQADAKKEEKWVVLKDTGNQLVQVSPKTSQAFVEKLKLRLSVKECKVRQLMDRIKELEVQLARAMESSVEMNLQRSIAQNYERGRKKIQYLEELVSKLKQQVQQLKSSPPLSGTGHQQPGVVALKVKGLQQELEGERRIVQSMASELAQYRSKGLELKSSRAATDNSAAELKAQKLKGVVSDLTAKICELQHTYQQLSTRYGGLRASIGTPEVLDEFCVPHAARDLDTKDVHVKLIARIRETQKKLTQCEQDLKVSETNRQFFEGKLQVMEERALSAELRLANESRKLKKAPEHQSVGTEASQGPQFPNQNSLHAKTSPGCVSLEVCEPEMFELQQVPDKKNSGMSSECSSDGGRDRKDIDDRKMVFANDLVILELDFRGRTAHCKLLSKRKFRITSPGSGPCNEKLPKGSSQGAESEAALETLQKEVGHLRSENDCLKGSRPSNVKYMNLLKKNKELNKTLVELEEKMVKASKSDPFVDLSTIEEVVAGLRAGLKRWSGNSPWVRALTKLEACCVNIKNKLSSTTVLISLKNDSSKTPSVKGNICDPAVEGQGSQGTFLRNDSELAVRLEEQASQLMQLQKELSQKIQAITNLNIQLDRRDSELNSLNGKIHLGNSEAATVTTCVGGDKSASPNRCDNSRANFEILQMENARLKASLAAAIDPKARDDLKVEVYKEVCRKYEQMLFEYTKQLGVPFKALRF